MIDLFGNDTEPAVQLAGHESKYQKFKRKNHYTRTHDEEKRCKECFHRCSYEYHDRYYHKCNLMGISSCEATDIRLSYVCDLFVQQPQTKPPTPRPE